MVFAVLMYWFRGLVFVGFVIVGGLVNLGLLLWCVLV